MPSGQKPTPSPLTREVGRIIAAAVVRRGLDPRNLMEPLSLSRSQVSRMLNGWKHWDIDQIDRACAYLELDPATVIDEADRATKSRPRPAPFIPRR